MTHQPHIDGLRSIAVMSVIVFHLEAAWLSGGFAGVDVFFVISGFLITQLIVTELEDTGQFRFLHFYTRRIRRLFPALLFTLLWCTLLALMLFTPQQLKSYGQELVVAIVSLSNVLFWLESGYFDAASHTKALLHSWSLSVEEQFYVLWPATLLLLWRRVAARWRPILLLGVLLLGLVLNDWLASQALAGFPNQRSALFFLLPFRVFEFMVGALGVWLARRPGPPSGALAEVMFLAGVCAIVVTMAGFDETTVWPSTYTLLPCVATLLLILSGQSRLCRWLLTNPPALWLGLISYSLYLVHWPVIVFFRYYLLGEWSSWHQALALGVTLMVSAFTYYAIERPFRYAGNRPSAPRRLLVAVGGCMGLMCVLGSTLYGSDGLERFTDPVLSVASIKSGKARRYANNADACRLRALESAQCDASRPVQVLVLGDSHEVDGYNAFHHLYAATGKVNLIRFGETNDCDLRWDPDGSFHSPTVLNACDKRFELLQDRAFLDALDMIVVSERRPFAAEKAGVLQMLTWMKAQQAGLTLVVLSGYLNTFQECAELANRTGDLNACRQDEFLALATPAQANGLGEQGTLPHDLMDLFIDKFALLCATSAGEDCLVQAGAIPAFYDQHHLSLEFAQLLGTRMGRRYGERLHQLGLPELPARSS